jgi:hypothetical protein
LIFIEIYVIIFQQKQNKEGCKLYIRFDGEYRVKWVEGKEYGFIALPDGKRAFVLKKVAWLGLNDEWGRPHIPGERIFYPELIKTPKGLWTVQYVGEWRLKEYERRLKLAQEGWQPVFRLALDLARPWWWEEDEKLRQAWLASGKAPSLEALLFEHRAKESRLREEFYERVKALVNLHDYYSGLATGRYGVSRGGYGADPEKIKGAVVLDRTNDVGHYHLYWSFSEDVPAWLAAAGGMGAWLKAACEAAKERT